MTIEPQSSNQPVSLEYVAALEKRVAQLERQQAAPGVLPNTQLLSPKFMTRAFAVWGHMIVAQLVLTILFYGGLLLIGAFVGGLGALFGN